MYLDECIDLYRDNDIFYFKSLLKGRFDWQKEINMQIVQSDDFEEMKELGKKNDPLQLVYGPTSRAVMHRKFLFDEIIKSMHMVNKTKYIKRGK
jgi:hypothetical protein